MTCAGDCAGENKREKQRTVMWVIRNLGYPQWEEGLQHVAVCQMKGTLTRSQENSILGQVQGLSSHISCSRVPLLWKCPSTVDLNPYANLQVSEHRHPSDTAWPPVAHRSPLGCRSSLGFSLPGLYAKAAQRSLFFAGAGGWG